MSRHVTSRTGNEASAEPGTEASPGGSTRTSVRTGAEPAGYTASLLRHFADLRDGTHGHAPAAAEESRAAKERLFEETVRLLAPHARTALGEMNTELLLGTGETTFTGVRRTDDGGTEAAWELSWPEQQRTGIDPVRVHAFYGAGFHHPHLQGSTVGQWPLNVFTEGQAAAELPTLRAIAAADLHNLVFESDYRIIPAVHRSPGA